MGGIGIPELVIGILMVTAVVAIVRFAFRKRSSDR